MTARLCSRKLPFTPASNRSKRNENFEDVSLKALAGDEVFNCGITDVFGKRRLGWQRKLQD